MSPLTKIAQAFALSGTAIALIAGCERGNDPVKAVTETTKNVIEGGTDIMGEWQTECYESDLLDASQTVTYVFRGNEFEKRYEFFTDDRCESEAARLTYVGTFNIVDEPSASNVPEAEGIDLEYTEVTARASNPEGQDLLNSVNFCGKSDWPQGEDQTITRASGDTTCPVREVPAKVFDLYVVRDDKLYFGKTSWFKDQESLGERPTEINLDRAFNK